MAFIPNWIKRPNRQLVSGDFIIFDGCDWTIETSVSGAPGVSCSDVQSCIDCTYIMSQLTNTPSIVKNGCGFNVNMNYINQNINSTRDGSVLIVGDEVHNISTDVLSSFTHTFTNGSGFTNITNGGSTFIHGIDGMRVNVSSGDISVGLPTTNRNDGYILKRNDALGRAERGLFDDCFCEIVADCAIIQNLQTQINNITGGGPVTDDFTISGTANGTTQNITFTRQLGGTYTVDLSSMFTALSDNFVQSMTLSGNDLVLTMVSGTTLTQDLSSLFASNDDYVTAGVVSGNDIILTRNGGGTVTIVGGANDVFTSSGLLNTTTGVITFTRNDGSTYNVDISAFTPSGPTTDELVKVSANDTTESYLRTATGNANTTDTTNDGTVKVRINNPSADETLQYIVDLTVYNGDTNFVGNHTQDGDLTVNGVSNFNTGPVNFNETEINYNSNPTLLGCTGATAVSPSATIAIVDSANYQYVEVTLVYDNTATVAGDTWTKTVTLSSNSGVVTVTDAPNSGEITLEIVGTDVVATLVDGTGTVTADVCSFNGVTTMNIDAGTIINDNGSTTNNNGTTVYNVGVNEYYDNTSQVTYDGTVINNYAITENYLDQPELIGCETTPVVGTPYTAPTDAIYVDVVVSFDSGAGAVTKTFSSPIAGLNDVRNFTSGFISGQMGLFWTGNDVTLSVLFGDPAFFTIDSICRYRAVSVNNYQNKIHNHDGDVFNYTNTDHIYDNTTNVTMLGDTTIENLDVTNITVNGAPIGVSAAHIEHFTATAGQTTFTLANTPASQNFVWMSSGSSLYAKQDPLYDYTVSGNVVTLNTPATAGDIITVQYIESVVAPTPGPTITTGVTASMTGTSLVVTDPNATTTSVITWTAQTSTAGFIEVIPGSGSFTINSSASESGVIFNYVITN